jgi:NAD+ diphosphatase
MTNLAFGLGLRISWLMDAKTIRAELSATTGFADNPLDRRAELREREDEVALLLDDPRARTIVIAGETPVMRRDGEILSIWFDIAAATGLGPAHERVFLGIDDDLSPCFGTLIDRGLMEHLKENTQLHVSDLRSVAMQRLVPASSIGPLGEAKAMLDWHARHRFCAQCGSGTLSACSGWKRACPSCGAQHFPRTDPAVIMLVVRGEKCFMARQSRFPPGVYSCIAGFVEPGETLEDAVRRETWEEAGLRTGTVRYLACQPWPFPSSLMIGCIAEALGDTITLDHDELEDGRWFGRDEVIAILDRRHGEGLLSPPRTAIANTLMRAWALDGVLP